MAGHIGAANLATFRKVEDQQEPADGLREFIMASLPYGRTREVEVANPSILRTGRRPVAITHSAGDAVAHPKPRPVRSALPRERARSLMLLRLWAGWASASRPGRQHTMLTDAIRAQIGFVDPNRSPQDQSRKWPNSSLEVFTATVKFSRLWSDWPDAAC